MEAKPEELVERRRKIRDKIIESYPKKVGKDRAKHILVKDSSQGPQKIEADVRTIPGILTSRGCAYAGCKGVVFGPVKDMVHITHGPIGCAYYTWATRRNFARPEEGRPNYLHYCFSTDMQEGDIVFGGEKKLMEAIREAYRLFKPEAIGVFATCPVGLIGDDLAAVARQAREELGVNVVPVNCEGYRGVSQSAGHHLASNALMEHVVGTEELPDPGPFDINLFGEYNIGGDAWEIVRLLERIGCRVVSVFTGDASYHDIARAHQAKLSLLHCHRSINYTNRMMEDKYGVPWLKINFIGVSATARSLRDVARFFGDQAMIERTEEVIAQELSRVEPEIQPYRERLDGKKVMVFVGGSRAHHWQELFADLGMEVVLAGYQFAHRDDYEGRGVIPEIKHNANRRVIEDLHLERAADARPAFDEEWLAGKRQELPSLMDYEGMMPHMREGAFVVDDLNHFETEELIKELKPDLFCSGVKDKYIFHKMGVPSRQAHSYDYSGPYAGFTGAVNFARDIEMDVNSPTWGFITPPWRKVD